MEWLKTVAQYAGNIATIIAAAVLIFKPLREKFLVKSGIDEAMTEAVKCILRQLILNVYYEHKDEKKIRQHQFENVVYMYKAYKALGGNSFIDRIYEEIGRWEVVT